jgi:hypothetical protein
MAKKVKNKYPVLYHYYNDMWLHDYYYCLGWSRENIINFISETYSKDVDISGAVAAAIVPTSGQIFIWTEKIPRNSEDLSILAHECVHAANSTFSNCGYRVDMNNDESQAYMVSLLFKKALQSIEKKR